MFEQRSNGKELMDDLSASGEIIDKTLQELNVINKWLGGVGVTLGGLNKIFSMYNYPDNKPIHVADIGCGGTYGIKAVNTWAKSKNFPVTLTGFDANPYIVELSTQETEHFPNISFKCKDVLAPDFQEEDFDIAICSLFCHHFTNEELKLLLRNLYARTKIAVLINDLHRHPLAYYSIKALTRLFSKSEMIKHDAPLSVARAFKKKELHDLLNSITVRDFEIRWKWAFRYQVILWKK